MLTKRANLRLICTSERQKCFQLQEALPPDPMTRGSAPRSPLGLCRQIPAISSHFTLTMSPPLYDEVYAYEQITIILLIVDLDHEICLYLHWKLKSSPFAV